MRTPILGTEPSAGPARPRGMRRLATTLAALTLATGLAAGLAGCGSEGDDVATDPEPTATASSPTAAPSVGTYPDFEPADYTYTLVVSCFCPGAGTPIAVTVVDDEVTDAVYGAAEGGRGGDLEGQQADEAFRLTVDDVIEQANDTDAARVDVDWPAGQDWPTSVYVDHAENVADDEVGYTLSDVQVA